MTADSRAGSDSSGWETKTISIESDWEAWRSLTFQPGKSLRLGSRLSSNVPDGELTGIGFYSPPLSSQHSLVRIRDIKLFAKR